MQVNTITAIYLNQDDVKTALLDYVKKVNPQLKTTKEPTVTCTQSWNFTVTLETGK